MPHGSPHSAAAGLQSAQEHFFETCSHGQAQAIDRLDLQFKAACNSRCLSSPTPGAIGESGIELAASPLQELARALGRWMESCARRTCCCFEPAGDWDSRHVAQGDSQPSAASRQRLRTQMSKHQARQTTADAAADLSRHISSPH